MFAAQRKYADRKIRSITPDERLQSIGRPNKGIGPTLYLIKSRQLTCAKRPVTLFKVGWYRPVTLFKTTLQRPVTLFNSKIHSPGDFVQTV